MIWLPYPPSLNTYYRHVGRKVLISEEGLQYRNAAAGAVRAAIRDGFRPILTGPLRVLVQLAPCDRRRRDLDNALKAMFDAMTKAGAWGDDSQIHHLTAYWMTAPHPCASIDITSMPSLRMP